MVGKLASRVRELARDERGTSLWEYALLIAVGLGVVAVLFILRDQIIAVFRRAGESLNW